MRYKVAACVGVALHNYDFEEDDVHGKPDDGVPVGWSARDAGLGVNGDARFGGLSSGSGRNYAVLEKPGAYLEQRLENTLTPFVQYRVSWVALQRGGGGASTLLLSVAGRQVWAPRAWRRASSRATAPPSRAAPRPRCCASSAPTRRATAPCVWTTW